MKKDNYNDNGSDVVKTLDSDNPLPSPSINKQQQQHFYQNKLLSVKNFNDAFELVKSAVDDQFKMHRAGLSLGITSFANTIRCLSRFGFKYDYNEQTDT